MKFFSPGCAAFILAICADPCAAQVITTIAGTNWSFPATPISAVKAPLGYPGAVAVDAKNNVYATDSGNNIVVRIAPDGTLSVVAGNGLPGYSGDGGPATSASLNNPSGIALDTAEDLFISDSFNHVVRKVTADGTITTIVGNGTSGFSGDGGPAASAQLSSPSGLAVDVAGNLYIADTVYAAEQSGNFVRKVAYNGIITTVAKGAEGGNSCLGNLSPLNLEPEALAVDAAGNLYIADIVLCKLTPAGTITAVGTGFGFPAGIAVDAHGNLFFASGNYVNKITPAGGGTLVAGGHFGYSGDSGPATLAALNYVSGVAVDAAGAVYIADTLNGRIRKVSTNGIISTLAGNGRFEFSGDGSPAVSAAFNDPIGIALNAVGDLFIADAHNNRIRKMTNGFVTTYAGNGILGVSGDGGPATSASLAVPFAVSADTFGDIFVATSYDSSLREINTAGIIAPFGGQGGVDGVAVDSAGNVYVANNCPTGDAFVTTSCIQKETPDGTAAAAIAVNGSFAFPTGIAVDNTGDLYFADGANNRVRRVAPNGIITTVAGSGAASYSGDGGPATFAGLNYPTGLAVDAVGNVYIADSLNNAIRKVTPDGFISTFAGNGGYGFSGDGGAAMTAMLNYPNGVAVDNSGNVYIADSNNNRIRVVLAQLPSTQVSPTQLQFTASSNGAPATPQTLSLTSPVEGLAFSATAPNDASWLQVTPSGGASPRLIQVTANPIGLAPNTYQTTITIDTPFANPPSSTVTVTFSVKPGQPPSLSIDKTNLSFPFPRHGSVRSQTITVSNSGGGTLDFTARPTTVTGGPWLLVSPANGQALPASPATLTVTADPTGISPGTYTGEVTVTAGTQSQNIPVTMTISTRDQAILLSQTGLSYLGVSQGGVLPPQSFGVLNIGTGILNWSVSTSTLAAGGTWLQVTPASGSTDAAGSVPTVQVSVDAASLPAGKYYGLVRVDAPGAANTPQVVTVVVQVLPPGSPTGAVIQPAELLFTATAGAESPGSQNLFVYNVATAAKSFQASADKVLNLAILPTNATLDPQQPTRIVVQPFTGGLAAGVYTGVITLQFSDGLVLSANVRLIVAAAGSSSGSSTIEQGHDARKFDASTACTPKKLVLASNTLAQSFKVPAGYPVGLEVNVKDDCKNALTAGSVTASFSNGDPELQLQSLKNGLWSATWQTNSSSESAVSVTLQANDVHQKLQGKSVVNTSLTATTDQPVFALEGVVSAAGLQRFVPVAPGSIISIYGKNLAGNKMLATSVPLPSQLADAAVFIAGRLIPLYYVSDKQINAQIPFDIDPNATSQLLVLRGAAYSLPVGVDIALAQPAIFTDTSVASNQGFIYVVRGKEQFEAKPTSPASEGDVIVMFCSGLGAVNPAIAAGAPANGQTTAITPTVTIGGLNAAVNFSGLTPGLVGLYQINAVVPKGVPTGNTVPVTINIAGQTSPQVVMAIQ